MFNGTQTTNGIFVNDIKNNRAPSNNAGSADVYIEPGVGPALTSIVGWFSEFYSRQAGQGFFVADGVDKQRDPPLWMEHKDQTVLGHQVTRAMRGDNWWEKKYARELAIADIRLKHRDNDFSLEKHDIVGSYRTVMRYLGMWPEPMKGNDFTKAGEEEYEKQKLREEKEEEEKLKMNWRAFMAEAIESDKPLATVALKYRNVYDVYGLDEFLDRPASFIWLTFKIGMFLGVLQGGWRAMKLLHIDAHFLQISGIGVLAFINTSILAGMIKWAGNTTLCSCMFILGDRLTWSVKYLKWKYLPSSSPSTSSSQQNQQQQQQQLTASQKQLQQHALNIQQAQAMRKKLHSDSTLSDAEKSIRFEELTKAEQRFRELQQRDAVRRSPVNYSVGLACSFGVAGIMPWWMLGDVALGLRFTAAGASIGGVLGYGVGLIINNMIAINLGRLHFSQHQFRSYQSMLKVEKMSFEAEVERRKRLEAAINEGVSGTELVPHTT